jgi:hypothetical protein
MNEFGLSWLDSNPFILSLWRLREEGHAIYAGERCQVSMNPDSCPSCQLLAENIS